MTEKSIRKTGAAERFKRAVGGALAIAGATAAVGAIVDSNHNDTVNQTNQQLLTIRNQLDKEYGVRYSCAGTAYSSSGVDVMCGYIFAGNPSEQEKQERLRAISQKEKEARELILAQVTPDDQKRQDKDSTIFLIGAASTVLGVLGLSRKKKMYE